MGGDGEPFIALNLARIVYPGFFRFTGYLNEMHREFEIEGQFSIKVCRGIGWHSRDLRAAVCTRKLRIEAGS